jgi:hypothetical protein
MRLISLMTRALLACGLCIFPLLPACQIKRPVGPLRDGDAACQSLVDVCAKPAAELGEPFQSCYQTGVNADGNECLSVYDTCLDACTYPPPPLGGGGEGGEAGQAGSSGAAGAAENGGASEVAGAGGQSGSSAGAHDD